MSSPKVTASTSYRLSRRVKRHVVFAIGELVWGDFGGAVMLLWSSKLAVTSPPVELSYPASWVW